MQFTVYDSTDTGAPVLTGQNGKVTDLLIAGLSTGYGAKAGAGWNVAFSATNKLVLKNAVGGRQHCLRILDDGSGGQGAKEALIRAYESMSDIDTGTDPYPTVDQAASGNVIRKSASADATARAWTLFATPYTFHLFIFTGDTAGQSAFTSFGDFYRASPNDQFSSYLIADTTNQVGWWVSSALNAYTYLARGQSGGSTKSVYSRLSHGKYQWGSGVTDGLMTIKYPSTLKLLARLAIHGGDFSIGSAGAPRGYIPGVWGAQDASSGFANGDTFSGHSAGPLAGRTFRIMIVRNGPASKAGALCMETSNTIETPR